MRPGSSTQVPGSSGSIENHQSAIDMASASHNPDSGQVFSVAGNEDDEISGRGREQSLTPLGL